MEERVWASMRASRTDPTSFYVDALWRPETRADLGEDFVVGNARVRRLQPCCLGYAHSNHAVVTERGAERLLTSELPNTVFAHLVARSAVLEMITGG